MWLCSVCSTDISKRLHDHLHAGARASQSNNIYRLCRSTEVQLWVRGRNQHDHCGGYEWVSFFHCSENNWIRQSAGNWYSFFVRKLYLLVNKIRFLQWCLNFSLYLCITNRSYKPQIESKGFDLFIKTKYFVLNLLTARIALQKYEPSLIFCLCIL